MIFTILMMSAAAAASPQTTVPTATPFAAAPMDPDALDRATAREDLGQIAVSDQTAGVSNNTINGSSVTGSVSINGNAFQNVQGLTILNANSGNNVAINASMTVNLQFSPGK